MSNTNKPNIKITFTREVFNSLCTMFAYYKATEIDVGETYYSYNSAKLESKIVQYGRFVRSESGDSVVVYFFPIEIIQLTDLLAKYINLRECPDKDYFSIHESTRKKIAVVPISNHL
jgi:hypothetical protein